MNLPNKLSLLRVALIPVLVVLMYQHNLKCQLLAALVFIVASLTDFLDGYIARRDKLVTDFGKFIDPVADKLLNLSAMMMLSYNDLLMTYVVILILARELAVDGLRMVAVSQGRVIAAGWLGKVKTFSQMLLIIWLMLPGTLWTNMEPVRVVSLVGIAWVVVITLWSGIDYFARNWDCITNVK